MHSSALTGYTIFYNIAGIPNNIYAIPNAEQSIGMKIPLDCQLRKRKVLDMMRYKKNEARINNPDRS